MKGDLKLWGMFLHDYNGITIIREHSISNSKKLHMVSDASKQGFGGTFATQWIQSKWPKVWEELNITILEIFPTLVLVSIFCQKNRSAKIIYHCDNQAVVAIINSGTSKDKKVVAILRPLVLKQLENNTLIRAEHIPGVNNVLSDAFLVTRRHRTF